MALNFLGSASSLSQWAKVVAPRLDFPQKGRELSGRLDPKTHKVHANSCPSCRLLETQAD